MKKVLVVALSAILAVSMFTACGSKNQKQLMEQLMKTS